MDIGSVLIANRGEVAVRVVRACRALGLRSIAVYSDADADASHVRLADAAARLGPASAGESYLNVAALLDAAATHGADAVHPGYGLLAEHAGFAAAVRDKGMAFVGPDPDVMAAMGDKPAARAVATRCGVPVLPGTDTPVDPEDPGLGALAARIGWPLLVKAAHGGGGRGMRVVGGPDELAEALRAAGREATAAFGRGEVFLERCLQRPRHVEVQVLGDAHGPVVHLGDRDCTVQRRHQKLIEEAPAPALDDELRAALRASAVRLATEVGYLGAGTVEFLVDPARGEFAFLEMNTRLQVEHGVTELVTGVDIVAAQLRVATGAPLGFGQQDVRLSGHAVQARVAAEDPWQGFTPAPGRITALRLPGGPGVRCDFGYDAGDVVPREYDSLVGKVHAWAPSRDEARARLGAALDELVLGGLPSTAPYLRTVLDEPDFATVTHDTGSLQRQWQPDPARRPEPPADTDQVPVRRVHLATDRGELRIAVPGRRRGGPSATGPRAGRPADGETPVSSRGPGEPIAPMDATVLSVPVSPGDAVVEGTVLAVLEAMKMELPVCAARDATVTAVHVAAGETVTAGRRLVELG